MKQAKLFRDKMEQQNEHSSMAQETATFNDSELNLAEQNLDSVILPATAALISGMLELGEQCDLSEEAISLTSTLAAESWAFVNFRRNLGKQFVREICESKIPIFTWSKDHHGSFYVSTCNGPRLIQSDADSARIRAIKAYECRRYQNPNKTSTPASFWSLSGTIKYSLKKDLVYLLWTLSDAMQDQETDRKAAIRTLSVMVKFASRARKLACKADLEECLAFPLPADEEPGPKTNLLRRNFMLEARRADREHDVESAGILRSAIREIKVVPELLPEEIEVIRLFFIETRDTYTVTPKDQCFEEFLVWNSRPENEFSCSACNVDTSRFAKCGHQICTCCVIEIARKNPRMIACPVCTVELFAFKVGENLLSLSTLAESFDLVEIVDPSGLNAICAFGILVTYFPLLGRFLALAKMFRTNSIVRFAPGFECVESLRVLVESREKLLEHIFCNCEYLLFPDHDFHGEGQKLIGQFLSSRLFPGSFEGTIDFIGLICSSSAMRQNLTYELAHKKITRHGRPFVNCLVKIALNALMIATRPGIADKLEASTHFLREIMGLTIIILEFVSWLLFGIASVAAIIWAISSRFII